MDIRTQIGRRIKSARGERTLNEIAKLTKNLTVSRISNYEQGLRAPGPEEAKELATALGNITAAEILCVDDESVLSADEKKLLFNYRAADSRGKKIIIGISELQPGYASPSSPNGNKPK